MEDLKMKTIISFVSIFLFFSSSFAGTIDPSTPDAKYVEYGAKFHSVVKICGSYEDGSLFCASASLIDDHNFLTAAHVVKGAMVCFVTINNDSFPIKNIIINKTFEDSFGVGDIAIGHSEKPFGLKYYPPLYEKDDEEDKVCSIAGYGLTGTFSTGVYKSDNKKRAGSNRIDYINSDLLICSPSRKGDMSYTSLEFMIGSGDSGGGLFIDGKLAAINSCVMTFGSKSPKSKYGEESGHTRVSKFLDWINEHKKKVD
jgi:hypothetical protein